MEMTQLVVKDNALIQASYTLSLVEQRLILLAIIEGREISDGITADSLIKINAKHYADAFHVHCSNAYEMLRDASFSLFNRYVTYNDKNGKRNRSFHCRWVDKIGYEEDGGYVYLRFTSDVIPLISRLEGQFTSYDLEKVSKLDSGYAIRIYEVLSQWKNVANIPMFAIDDFRSMIGVGVDQYKTMSNFKRIVLDASIKKINEFSDLQVSYEQVKKGRKIIGFKFKVKVKKQEVKKLTLTDKQRSLFASKLSRLDELSTYAPQGKTYDEYAKQIADELLTDDGKRFYLPYLKKVGLKI